MQPRSQEETRGWGDAEKEARRALARFYLSPRPCVSASLFSLRDLRASVVNPFLFDSIYRNIVLLKSIYGASSMLTFPDNTAVLV
jgi:hypothetical protein